MNFYRFYRGPWAEAFYASGSEIGYTANWTYKDADCRPQKAYRLILWDLDDNIVDDTGWINSAGTSHTATGIDVGDYILTLQLRNADNEDNGSWAIAVAVSAEGTVGSDPPTVVIYTPANAATVEGTVAVVLHATDDVGLASMALLIDGVQVSTWAPGGVGTVVYDPDYDWDTSGVGDGQHTITAIATDTHGQTAITTHIVTIGNGGTVGGGDPPTVEITAPADSATVSGTVNVAVASTDDTGLMYVRIKVDGGVVKAWEPGGEAVLTHAGVYALDTLSLGNGDHTITARATDIDGNAVEDSITVTVANSAIAATKYWFSDLFSSCAASNNLAAQIAEMVAAGRKIRDVELSAITEAAAVPENNYGLRFGIHCPGDSTDFAQYQVLTPESILSVAAFNDRQDARLGIEMFPLVTWTNWACDPGHIIDVQAVSDTKLIMLSSETPIKLMWWNGVDAASVWLDLDDTWAENYTPVAFRVLDAKCYIAAMTDDANPQPVILVQDLDSLSNPIDRQPYAIELRSRYPYEITDLEIADGVVYFGVDNGLGQGTLWQIDGNDVTPLSSFDAPMKGIRCLWADEDDNIWCGAADGTVYQGIVSDHSTGEDLVAGGLAYGGGQFVFTGTDGLVFRKVGAGWGEFAEAGELTTPAKAAVFRNRLWVGGDGPELYCYDFGTGIWQLYTTLSGWTSISEIVAFSGFLCVFGEGAGTLFKTLEITNAHLAARYVHELACAIVRTEPVS